MSGATLVREAGGQHALAGELTLANVGPLRDAGRATLAGAPAGPLVVDLAGVTRADSAGLALLVDWIAWARAAGRALSYEHVPEGLRALARLSDLEGLLG